jgi:hypothetical protein
MKRRGMGKSAPRGESRWASADRCASFVLTCTLLLPAALLFARGNSFIRHASMLEPQSLLEGACVRSSLSISREPCVDERGGRRARYVAAVLERGGLAASRKVDVAWGQIAATIGDCPRLRLEVGFLPPPPPPDGAALPGGDSGADAAAEAEAGTAGGQGVEGAGDGAGGADGAERRKRQWQRQALQQLEQGGGDAAAAPPQQRRRRASSPLLLPVPRLAEDVLFADVAAEVETLVGMQAMANHPESSGGDLGLAGLAGGDGFSTPQQIAAFLTHWRTVDLPAARADNERRSKARKAALQKSYRRKPPLRPCWKFGGAPSHEEETGAVFAARGEALARCRSRWAVIGTRAAPLLLGALGCVALLLWLHGVELSPIAAVKLQRQLEGRLWLFLHSVTGGGKAGRGKTRAA